MNNLERNTGINIELLTLVLGSIMLGFYLHSFCAGFACLLLGYTFYQPN